MAIAIAGAAGYVGRRLLDRLPNTTGYDLGGVARKHDRIHAADMRNFDRALDICLEHDYLIHLAAVSGVEECADNPSTAMRQNIEALSTAARACMDTDTHLIFPSSQAIYGDSLYGATKNIGEHIISETPDLEWTILEFSNIYGRYPYDGEYVRKRTVVEAFIDMAWDGTPLTVHRPGDQQRNFIHIDDVAAAYHQALDVTGRHRVAGPDTLSIRELAERIADRTDGEVEMVDADREGTEVDLPAQGNTLPGFEPSITLDQYVGERLTAHAAG